jgi:hypothetical protein
MHMRNYVNWKTWRLPALVVLTATMIAPATKAFPQQSGEATSYNPENLTHAGNLHIQMQGSLAEARNGGHQLDVWRANSNDPSGGQVLLSYDLGPIFTIGSTETMASPAVVAWGSGGNFMAFHTGTDGNIYYTFIFGPNSNFGFWQAIPGQTTPNNMSVSVAQIGQNSNLEFMVYHGASDDTRVFGTWLQNSAEWTTPTNIGGGRAVAPPSICLNDAGSSLWVTAIGTDNQVWTTSQPLGSANWPNWTPRGAFAGNIPATVQDLGFVDNPIQAPSCAATNNGNVVLDYVDSSAHPHYAVFNNGGEQITGWTEDVVSESNNWRTLDAVQLTSSGNTVWSLFTGFPNTGNVPTATGQNPSDPVNGFSGYGYWKTVYIVP